MYHALARAHSVVYAEEAADPPPAVGAFVDTARATFSANPLGISLFWNTAASVKNMMLYNATTSNPDRVCFLLGKTGPDEFACDYAYPLTALQAMGLALTAFHDMSRRLNLGLKGGKLGYKSGQGD